MVARNGYKKFISFNSIMGQHVTVWKIGYGPKLGILLPESKI